MKEMVFRATLDIVTEKIGVNPSVSAAAKLIGEHPDKLRADPDFWRRTTGKRKRNILAPLFTDYLLTRKE